MSRHLKVHPAATEELREQARYLNGEERGLGARFLRVANSAIEQAGQVPRLGQLIESDEWSDEEVRRRSVKQFKCHVVYLVDDDAVTVLAVAHDAREPLYWADRVTG